MVALLKSQPILDTPQGKKFDYLWWNGVKSMDLKFLDNINLEDGSTWVKEVDKWYIFEGILNKS